MHPRTKKNPRGAGAPVTVGGRPVQVYLDPVSRQIAIELGSGNISAGIREALRRVEVEAMRGVVLE